MAVAQWAAMRVFALLAAAAAATTTPVPIPGGEGGIGFDDLVFSSRLHRLVVPGGLTGNLDLIDPATRKVTAISGFSKESKFGGGHGEGTTSADEGRGLLFASDRSKRLLVVVDPAKRAVVASAKLDAGPDYVRFVPPTDEIWVTEPGAEQIEIFSLPKEGAPALTRVGVVHVAGGPESLVIDAGRDRAYTHLWKAATVAIDLHAHSVAGQWKNGCEGSRGIAVDEERALLFAGCGEGKATAMDLRRGGVVSSESTGKGVDVIAYSPQLHHLYAPGADSATMSVIAVSAGGKLSTIATVPTAKGAHCVAADHQGGAWVCDPDGGRLLVYQDAQSERR
jgi:DNA-binding beta-propeller fold protein YncE